MEVLICISILSILVILITPAYKGALDRGRNAKCVSNLRQIGAALFAYSADHQSKIPPRIEPNPNAPGEYLSGTYWHQVLRRQGYFGPPPPEGNKDQIIAAQKTGVHFCPDIPSTGTSDEAYGMRRWKSPGQPLDTSESLTSLPTPADFFLLTDSYMTSTKKQGYSLGQGSSSWRIRFGHSQKANTLFADGHVAAMSREYFDSVPVRQAEYGYSTEKYSYWPEESQ